MKKALSILLALTLALSLAVTALADEDTAPPTGDNVVKLTDTSTDEYTGDLYLVCSQPVKPAAIDVEQYKSWYDYDNPVGYEIPLGASVTVYWFYKGEFYDLVGDDIYLSFFAFDAEMEDFYYPEEAYNGNGTITYTFDRDGEYRFAGEVYGPETDYFWHLDINPIIVVSESISDTPAPTDPAPSTPVELPADVPADAWFAASAELALKHGLVSADNGKYDPDATQSLSNVAAALKALDPDSTVELYTGADRIATREDMVVMFWKHAGSPESTCSLAAFPDAGEVKNAAAWAWAVEKGLIYGTEKGLEPAATLPKSHLAQLAVRYMDILSK